MKWIYTAKMELNNKYKYYQSKDKSIQRLWVMVLERGAI